MVGRLFGGGVCFVVEGGGKVERLDIGVIVYRYINLSSCVCSELREIFGEVFLIVSPGQIYMNCSNAEAIVQMTMRRNDFPKPIEVYGIIDIYGSSILSTEGADWRRHRKIVAPAFSEKSNALVWKESVRQAAGMLKFWSTL